VARHVCLDACVLVVVCGWVGDRWLPEQWVVCCVPRLPRALCYAAGCRCRGVGVCPHAQVPDRALCTVQELVAWMESEDVALFHYLTGDKMHPELLKRCTPLLTTFANNGKVTLPLLNQVCGARASPLFCMCAPVSAWLHTLRVLVRLFDRALVSYDVHPHPHPPLRTACWGAACVCGPDVGTHPGGARVGQRRHQDRPCRDLQVHPLGCHGAGPVAPLLPLHTPP
jgi:hypothetical protein